MEMNGKPHEAYELLGNYLDDLPPLDEEAAYNQWSGVERMRLAAMAHKLGLMADTYSRSREEEEKWLTWAVQRTLKDIRLLNETSDRSIPSLGAGRPLRELELPDWVTRSDLLVFLESLGEFHAKTNKTRYVVWTRRDTYLDFLHGSLAIILYGQVLSILQTDFGDRTKLKNLCHAARVFSNQCELYCRPSLPKEGNMSSDVLLQKAEVSALFALKIIEFVQDNPDPNQVTSVCDETFGVAMANLATINTVSAPHLTLFVHASIVFADQG